MKTSLIALSLGLAASMAGTGAFANTGTINFEGRITASTCPIEVVNPGDGSIGDLVKMGSVDASRFTGVGQEYNGKAFALRVKGGSSCTINPTSEASVTFTGLAQGDYFAVGQTADAAKNVAISLRDVQGLALKPGVTSNAYELNDSGETDLLFNAYYRSTALGVTAGPASADIGFRVDIQ